jgi:hypothetical protein
MEPYLNQWIQPDPIVPDPFTPADWNRYAYVRNNPVNYADPSGEFPVQCQAMPSAREFEGCVLRYYGLTPADSDSIGAGITGSRGCYGGEFRYKAPGYLEGSGNWVWMIWWGNERVYSFARMESMRFHFEGYGVGTSVLGGGIVDYGGWAFGLTSTTSLEEHYKGMASSVAFGAALSNSVLGVPLGGATGLGGFVSHSTPRIWGLTWYVSGSVAYPIPPEFIDFSLGIMLNYVPVTGTGTEYAYGNGDVNRALLVAHILSGWSSPWRINPTEFRPAHLMSRAYAIAAALHYAHVYEELHGPTH